MVREKTHSRDQAADKSPRSGFHEALWTSCLMLVYNLKFPQCNVYKTGDIFCLELGSIPLEHVPLMVFHQLFVPHQQWTKHAALDKTWQFQPNMTRDFTEPCLCIAEHTFISISDRLFIWVITRFFRFSYGSLQEMYIIVFQVSGTMFVFPVFKMLPSYPDRFPARDDVFPDTFKCSVIKQISRIFIFFWRWSWKCRHHNHCQHYLYHIATTTINHHCHHHHYHNHHGHNHHH